MLHELDIIDFETGVDIMDIGHDDLLDLDVVEAAVTKSESRGGGLFGGLYPHPQQPGSQHEAHHEFHRDVLDNVPFQLMDTEAKGDHGVFDEFRIDLPDVLETKPKRQYKKRGPKSPRTPKAGKTTKLGRKRKSEELNVSSPKPKKMLKSFMSDSNIAVMPKRSLKKSQSDMGALAAPSKLGKKLMSPKSFGSDDSKGARQTSTFRGVSCCGKDRKWQARIRDANRVRYLGRYHTEVEAALEYDKVAREIKGGKAPTNFLPLSHEVTEAVKQSFAEHGYIIEKYQHLVVRSKAKSPPSSPRVAAAATVKSAKLFVPGGDFPDSPMAKIHSVNAAPCLNMSKMQAKPVSLMTQQTSSKLHPVVTKKGRALQLE